MDPYRILGVSRNCTREAAKFAFRARVWQAHPDRGGEAEAFIQICAAYKRILEELERSPSSGAPARARARGDARPAAPPESIRGRESGRLDEPPGWNRPPSPPDPNWEPDLVLLDHAPSVRSDPEAISRKAAAKTYASWLRRVAAEAQARRSIRRSAWFRTLGIVILLSLLGGNLWLCWIVWFNDPKEATREAKFQAPAAASRP
jgi:curved DNA-binding protein CbpA